MEKLDAINATLFYIICVVDVLVATLTNIRDWVKIINIIVLIIQW